MTTYIDRILTEVAVKPESPEGEGQRDTRWHDAKTIEAVLRMRSRQQERLRAEGRDD